ncbi:Cystathionine gamma-lyase [compost metagenome]
MTHKSIPREKRLQSGVADSLIRISCGIEEAEDLIKDLEQALVKAQVSATTTTAQAV